MIVAAVVSGSTYGRDTGPTGSELYHSTADPDPLLGEPYYDLAGHIVAYAVSLPAGDDESADIVVLVPVDASSDDILMSWSGLAPHQDPVLLATAAQAVYDRFGVVVARPERFLLADSSDIWFEYTEEDPRTGQAIVYGLTPQCAATLADLGRMYPANDQGPQPTLSGITYVISVVPEHIEYLPGQIAAFNGTVKTSAGLPVPNFRVGIDDAMQQVCMLGPYTDAQGRFRYQTRAPGSAGGLYAFAFYGSGNPVYCLIHVKNTPGLLMTDAAHSLNLGATLNTADINPALMNKLAGGSRVPTPTAQQLRDAADTVATFAAGTARNTLANFVSNPVNDVAALASVGCVAGIWTGVGTIPCAALYGWVAVQFGWSAAFGAADQAVAMSNLTAEQKTVWREDIKPGVKCIKGIVMLDPASAAVPLSADSMAWSCGQVVAHTVRQNGRDALVVAASPSASSQSRATLAFVLIPISEVTYPTASGVTWCTGQTYTVTWSGFTSSTVRVELYKGSALSRTIAASTANIRSLAWTVPADQVAGTDYRIKITSASNVAETASSATTFTIQVPPAVSSFAINNGAASTTSRTVTLNNVCTGNPTQYMASESSSFSGAAWQTYATAPSFTLSAGNGTKTVYLKVKGATGESAARSDTITLSEAAPTITSFGINNGAASTTSRTVTLNNVCTGNPTQYMASESASFSGAAWQPYSASPSFTLSSGSAQKTVYLKVRSAAGESAVRSDSIRLN